MNEMPISDTSLFLLVGELIVVGLVATAIAMTGLLALPWIMGRIRHTLRTPRGEQTRSMYRWNGYKATVIDQPVHERR